MAIEALLGGAFAKAGGGVAISQFLAASAPALAAGAGVGVAGIGSAVTQGNILEAQAEQAKINAEQIAAATEIEVFRERGRGRARVGAAEARAGGFGGVTRTGTAVSLIADELFEAQLNEAIVLSRGGQAVTRQRNIRNQRRGAGRSALTAGSINAVAGGINLGTKLGSIL